MLLTHRLGRQYLHCVNITAGRCVDDCCLKSEALFSPLRDARARAWVGGRVRVRVHVYFSVDLRNPTPEMCVSMCVCLLVPHR